MLWMAQFCPGAIRAQEGLRIEPNEAMIRGRVFHSVVASELLRRFKDICPETITRMHDHVEPEPWMLKTAREIASAIREAVSSTPGRIEKVCIEQNLTAYDHSGPMLTATPDAAFLTDAGIARIYDFKLHASEFNMLAQTGQSVRTSVQLKAQLAAFAGSEQRLKLAWLAYVHVRPTGDWEIEEYPFEGDALKVILQEVTILAKTAASSDVRIPGPHCGFCAASAQCQNFLPVSIEHVREPQPFTPERASAILDLKPRIDDLMERAKKLLLSLDSDRLASLGWEVKPGNKRRSIWNVQAACDALRKAGMTDADMNIALSLQFDGLARAVQQAFGLSKSAADRWIDENLHDWIEVTTGQPRLVRKKQIEVE